MRSQSETLATGVGETEMELGNNVRKIEAVLSDGVETKPKGTPEVENGISRLSELS